MGCYGGERIVAGINSESKETSYEATLMVHERVGVACTRMGTEEKKRTGFAEIRCGE